MKKRLINKGISLLLALIISATVLPWMSFASMVYAATDVAEQYEAENLALKATPEASSAHPIAPVKNINDGDTSNNSRWAIDDPCIFLPDENNCWCQLKWDDAVTFDTINLYEWYYNGYRANGYNLSISNDGKNFETIFTGYQIGSKKVIELEECVTAKYLRITVTSNINNFKEAACINEIEVFDRSKDANIYSAMLNGIEGVIDNAACTIKFVVDPGVDLTAVSPIFEVASGAKITANGSQNGYTVVAKDGVTTKNYTVIIEAEKSFTDADLSDKGTADVDAFGPVPSDLQYQYHRDELAAFCCFSMNTFTGAEWGSGNESPSNFNLTEKADTDAYIKTLKDAGFKMVLVVAKHHDGFCIWDSKWTEHDTASTYYPGGDVLADLSEACTKYDMDMALYLSPWDANSKYYGYYDAEGNPTTKENDVLDYNEYFANQMIEILGNDKYGNNGKFIEFWLDGAKGSGADAQDYDFDRWNEILVEYEGDILINNGQHDVKKTVQWVGNESGKANEETWCKALETYDEDGNLVSWTFGPWKVINGNYFYTGIKNGNVWAVPEVDVSITSGWFWGENKATPRTLETLKTMYLESVGYGVPLLLNVPLNNKGTLDDAIRERVEEFGANIQGSFANNLAAQDGVTIYVSDVYNEDVRFKPSNMVDNDDMTYWTATPGTKEVSIIVDFGDEVTFDALTIEEEIKHGQRVEAFSIFYKSDSGEWINYSNGHTICAKRIVQGRNVTTSQIKIKLWGMTDDEGNVGTPVISSIGVYKVTEDFQIGSDAPEGITEIDNIKSNFVAEGWDNVSNLNAIGAGYYQGTTGDTMTITFTGSKAWLVGLDSSTNMSVSVDGQDPVTVNRTKEVFFETGDLTYGEHTLTLTVYSGTAKIDGLYVLDNEGKGMLDFEYSSYTVEEDQWFEVKVIRKGGSKGTITAIVQDNPGSAVQSSFVPTGGIPVVFADGETEKTVRIRTKRYTEATGKLFFTLDIVAGADEDSLVVGFNSPAVIYINDAEGYEGEYLKDITVTEKPTKTDYIVGEELDLSGLVIEGTYACSPDWSEIAVGNRIGIEGKVIEFDEPVSARHLRLTLLSTIDNKNDIPCIAEIMVYDSTTGKNIALSATATAISEHSAPFTADNVNDGNVGNRWAAENVFVSTGGLPCWVQLNWDEMVTFDKIVIYEWNEGSYSIRADQWKLEVATASVDSRVMEDDQYTITSDGDLSKPGIVTYTVTANSDPTKTATFSVNAFIAHDCDKNKVMPYVAPTCTETGLTEGYRCSVCNKIMVAQEELPALGHNMVDVEGKAPTCTEEGLSESSKCSRCDEVIAPEVIPALGHDWKAADCTTPKTCKVCGETEGAALGHNDNFMVVAPTCTEGGYTIYTCDTCGDSYIGSETEALGHDWIDATTEAPKTCKTCGATEGDKLPEETPGTTPDPTPDQDTHEDCEAGWFANIWNAIINFFRRLFGLPEKCVCGKEI